MWGKQHMASTLNQYPRRDSLYSVTPEGIAALNRHQNRVVMLDTLGSEVWLRADGLTTLREIARDIAGISGMPVNVLLRTVPILAVVLNSEGLLYLAEQPASLPYHLAAPQEDQDQERMVESMIEAGWINHS